jgi:membrane dipeptidase
MIRALSERGGIAGLNYYAPFLDTDPTHPENCRSTVELIAKHAAHYKQVGGAQMIALGSDFDGTHQLENAAFLPLLADALRKEGFTEDEVEGIYYRNAMRFFEENL